MSRTMRKRGNGEGTIYYSESKKKWIGQTTIGRDFDGKQIRKTFYGDTRKEVKDRMEELQREMDIGHDVSNTKTMVEHILDLEKH